MLIILNKEASPLFFFSFFLVSLFFLLLCRLHLLFLRYLVSTLLLLSVPFKAEGLLTYTIHPPERVVESVIEDGRRVDIHELNTESFLGVR